MKITVLAENTTCREDCGAEHGLSLLVETNGHIILFDAGQTTLFAANARTLGVDLGAVEMAVLSHGHYDHGGGLMEFLRLNDHAPVYVSEHAFEPHYNGGEKYIGLDAELTENDRVIAVADRRSLLSGIELIPWGDEPPACPVESAGLSVMCNGSLVPEDFRHEQYMLVEEKGRRVLFSGCSHKGILNIMNRFRPDVLVGGFHFMKLDPTSGDADKLSRMAGILSEYDTEYYTCHCTGTEQYEYLHSLMGERLHYLSVGMTVEL